MTRDEIVQFTNRYGSGNCWTGTIGTACVIIRQLLLEVADARREAEKARDAARRLTWVDTGELDG